MDLELKTLLGLPDDQSYLERAATLYNG